MCKLERLKLYWDLGIFQRGGTNREIGIYRIFYKFMVDDGHTCVRVAQAPR